MCLSSVTNSFQAKGLPSPTKAAIKYKTTLTAVNVVKIEIRDFHRKIQFSGHSLLQKNGTDI